MRFALKMLFALLLVFQVDIQLAFRIKPKRNSKVGAPAQFNAGLSDSIGTSDQQTSEGNIDKDAIGNKDAKVTDDIPTALDASKKGTVLLQLQQSMESGPAAVEL
mmetsp:Transcript_77156/g.141742  ORF Transcript_77156/g.141742 Transcript_77156/m.141742 type:complete len:105 (+) Transcript_77156:74-388(+)